MDLYPLRFEPIFKQYLWGGRRLESVLGKVLGQGETYAESWEVVDHGKDQSIVKFGPLAGTRLTELSAEYGEQLFGRRHPQSQFPLLLKFLDANKTLSVQVHPNDAQAKLLSPPDLGKTEAWVVLSAEPGSKIYAGLEPGVDRVTLERHLKAGTCDECLHVFEPQVGDCILLLAGTVHAIGAGLLIAEIQQASNTTFRLFDWNRVDKDGHARELHIDQSLEVTNFERGPVTPQTPTVTNKAGCENLANCDKFILDRWAVDQPVNCGGDDRFHVLAVLEGEISIAGDPSGELLSKGESVLLPASIGGISISPQESAVILDMYLPAR